MKMSELREKAEQGGSVANHQFVRGFPQGPKSTFRIWPVTQSKSKTQ